MSQAHAHQRPFAALQGVGNFAPESGLLKRCAIWGNKLTVKPGRTVMVNLLFQTHVREGVDAHVGTVAGMVKGKAAFGQILGDLPMALVEPLDMTCTPQSFEPADVGFNKGFGITAKAAGSFGGKLDVLGWPINALFVGDVHDVAIRRTWLNAGGYDLDDFLAADVFGARGVQFDMMDAAINPVDYRLDTVAHFIAAKSFGQDTAHHPLFNRFAM
jgi:hypothetical protein